MNNLDYEKKISLDMQVYTWSFEVIIASVFKLLGLCFSFLEKY